MVELAPDNVKLKKALETASKIGAQYVLIVAEQGIEEERFQLKEMSSGTQRAVTRQELFDLFSNRAAGTQ